MSCMRKWRLNSAAKPVGTSEVKSGVISMIGAPSLPSPTASKALMTVPRLAASTPRCRLGAFSAHMSYVHRLEKYLVSAPHPAHHTAVRTDPGATKSDPVDSAANSMLTSMSRSSLSGRDLEQHVIAYHVHTQQPRQGLDLLGHVRAAGHDLVDALRPRRDSQHGQAQHGQRKQQS